MRLQVDFKGEYYGKKVQSGFGDKLLNVYFDWKGQFVYGIIGRGVQEYIFKDFGIRVEKYEF